MTPTLPRRRFRASAVLKLLVFAAVLFAFDGPVGATIALAIGVALAFGQPPRRLILAGAAFLASVPVVVLLRGLPSPAMVSPLFVLDNNVANHLTFAGLALMVTGLVIDGARRRSPTQTSKPTQPLGE
jgi:hypothetical protein